MTCSDLLTVLSYSILNVIACALVVHRSCCCRCSMSFHTSHTVTWCSRSWLRGAGWRRERSCLPSHMHHWVEGEDINICALSTAIKKVCVFMCVCARVRACVHPCVICACVRVCDMRVCMCVISLFVRTYYTVWEKEFIFHTSCDEGV